MKLSILIVLTALFIFVSGFENRGRDLDSDPADAVGHVEGISNLSA